MKKLYILRHAEALSAMGDSDHNRKLSAQGNKDSLALGRFMAQHNFIPDAVLCSSAVRTCETMNNVLTGLTGAANETIETETCRSMYNAPKDNLLNEIRNVSDLISSVLVVAHNPGIHELAFRLSGKGEETLLRDLSVRYSPGTLSVFECPIEDWQDLCETQNTILGVYSPAEYNSDTTPRPTEWM